MFPCEVWSFGWSNFDQNHFKRVQLSTVPFLFSLGSPSISAFASPRVTPASSSPLKCSPLPSRSPSPVSPTRSLPRVALSSQRSRGTLAPPLVALVPLPAIHCRSASIPRAPSCTASPRTHVAPSRARVSRLAAESAPLSSAATAIRAGAPPLTPTTSFRPPSTQIESLVSFSALSSPFPTPSPLESRTAGAGAPPRKPCCAAGARRAPPLRGPARRRRAPRGRRAPLVVAPPPPAGALLRHGRNGPATARRREPPSPLALAPPRAACALAPAPPCGRPRSAGPP